MNDFDPTGKRLSEHFLLSDFLGCNSVYSKGYANPFVGEQSHLREGATLCETLLEPLLDRVSRFSISYGYLSPELSRKTVTYQSPDKPSYHRWDDGAACDICLHEYPDAPVLASFWIDENTPASRIISYSESPYICVATRAEEVRRGDPRRALYENRFVGERKPQYINYNAAPRKRAAMKEETQKLMIDGEHNWVGAGYPTYHGGGKRQLQHIRTSRFTMLSDFLYSTYAVYEGVANAPHPRSYQKFNRAGDTLDWILLETGIFRFSIVRAYENPSWSDSRYTWKDAIYLDLVAPEGTDIGPLIAKISKIEGISRVKEAKNGRILLEIRLKS